jgi:hypothetical protein
MSGIVNFIIFRDSQVREPKAVADSIFFFDKNRQFRSLP